MTISDDQLSEWERLCEVATAGPWRRCHANDPCSCGLIWSIAVDDTVAHCYGKDTIDERLPVEAKLHNSDFIAASRTALPLLLAEVRAMRSVVEAAVAWSLPQPFPSERARLSDALFRAVETYRSRPGQGG